MAKIAKAMEADMHRLNAAKAGSELSGGLDANPDPLEPYGCPSCRNGPCRCDPFPPGHLGDYMVQIRSECDRYRSALERIAERHRRNIPGYQCRCDACSISHRALFPLDRDFDPLGDPQNLADHLATMLLNGTTACPLCGNTHVHDHTPLEIIIYRNGVKYGKQLSA